MSLSNKEVFNENSLQENSYVQWKNSYNTLQIYLSKTVIDEKIMDINANIILKVRIE